MKIVCLLAVFVLLMPSNCLAGYFGRPLKVGVVISMTGEDAMCGAIQRNSYHLAVDEINVSGGVYGSYLSLIIEDDNGQPDIAEYAAKKLVLEDKVDVLTGGSGTECAIAIGHIAESYKVPYLITLGSVDEVTEKGWKYVFRICPPLSSYFAPVMSFLENVVKPKRSAIIYGDSLFGRRSADFLEEAFQKSGGELVAREFFRTGSTNFRSLLTKVKKSNPDVVFLSSSSFEGALLLQQSRELELFPKIFVGVAQGFASPNFVLNAGENSDFVFSIELWGPRLPYPGAQEYFDNYVLRFLSSTNYHGAQAYASVQVIADAWKRATTTTREAIRNSMATTDVETVYGPVRFVNEGKKTQQNFPPTFLGQWISGMLEIVWPVESETEQYVYPVPGYHETRE